MNIILLEFSFICILVTPYKFSLTLLHAIKVHALIKRAIRPLLNSLAVHFIGFKLTLIPTACKVLVNTLTISHTFLEITFIDIALSVDQSTIATHHVILPEAFVPISFWPYLYTFAVFQVCFRVPFALIN